MNKKEWIDQLKSKPINADTMIEMLGKYPFKKDENYQKKLKMANDFANEIKLHKLAGKIQ